MSFICISIIAIGWIALLCARKYDVFPANLVGAVIIFYGIMTVAGLIMIAWL